MLCSAFINKKTISQIDQFLYDIKPKVKHEKRNRWIGLNSTVIGLKSNKTIMIMPKQTNL